MHFTVIYPQLYNQLLTTDRVCQRNIFSILNNSNNCVRKLESAVLNSMISKNFCNLYPRVSVQGVKPLGSHFACLCREFDFYEVKNNDYFS